MGTLERLQINSGVLSAVIDLLSKRAGTSAGLATTKHPHPVIVQKTAIPTPKN
jgi:hypothetical protein